MTVLKSLRLAAGMTQKELAAAAGLNPRQCQKFENGESAVENMTAANFIRLADALKVDPHELLKSNKI